MPFSRTSRRNMPAADFRTHISAFHQGLHHIRIDILATLLPVAGHGLGLVFVGDGEVEADQDGFSLPDFAVDDVVLVCGFIEIGDDADLVS